MAETDEPRNLTLWTQGDGKSRAARTAEILLTLARFGFGELVERAWWARWLPGSPPEGDAGEEAGADAGGAARLRQFFEALGPSFVKIGQLLALHAGALPPAYRDELSRLLDNTLPLPFSVMEAVLSEEMGADWHQFFREIERQPLASASIGQVHTGVLQNGDRVAVKVQRPGAQVAFERDFDIVRDLVRYTRLHTVLRMTRQQLEAIVDEVVSFTRFEFDYCHEAGAARRLREMGIEGMYAPRVYDTLSTSRVLVTEYIAGITLNDVLEHLPDEAWLAQHGVDRNRLARQMTRNQLVQALECGFFQADPHPANIIVMDDGRLGYVDFGIVGELDEQTRRDIVDMALYEMLDDFERVWPILLRYGRPTERTDLRAFKTDFKALSERYKQEGVRSFAVRSLGFYVEEQLRLYHKHHMRVATGWATYMRSIIVYGNTAALLSEELNFMRDNLPVFQEIKLRQTLGDLTPERVWTELFVRQGYDLQRSLRALSSVLRRAEEGELSILEDESPRLEKVRNTRLRAALWAMFAFFWGWMAVVLRDEMLFAPIGWPAVAVLVVALCLWRLALALRGLR
ncbi:MAG: AarF/ABC1/UbiB kinase family protein [Anaerolineae bacterium]|nr:AarF/ABC1/UbiB kinase family protein [Anaerolineae bacterium]